MRCLLILFGERYEILFARITTNKDDVNLELPKATRWSLRMRPTQQKTDQNETEKLTSLVKPFLMFHIFLDFSANCPSSYFYLFKLVRWGFSLRCN